jgi:hypothetical protein
MFNTATDSPFTPAAAIVNRAQAELVDAAGEGRLMVIGGLPPTGRDLDLLVPDGELPQLEAALKAAASRPATAAGSAWCPAGRRRSTSLGSRPGGCPAACRTGSSTRRVSSRPTSGWSDRRLSDDLLVLARRGLGIRARWPTSTGGGSLERSTQTRALGRPPAPAPVRGACGAPFACCSARTSPGRHRGDCGRSQRPKLRAATGAGWRGATGRLPPGARSRPATRGAVIALSGIDGSGKSALAAALAQALLDLGHDAALEWSRITYDPVLRAIGAGPSARLALLERGGPREHYKDGGRPPDGRGPPAARRRGFRGAHRRRVPALNLAWTNDRRGWRTRASQRRTLRAHLREGPHRGP